MIEDRDTILELTAKIQELQNEVNCMSDSKDFKDAESVRSGLFHVTSQLAFSPLFPDPGGIHSTPVREDFQRIMGLPQITKQDIDECGATIGCPGCNAIKDNKRAQAHADRCRTRIEECLRTAPHGAERLDRRNEVINEEIQRGEQRKKRSSIVTTAAIPAPEPAALAAQDLREDPIEPDLNSKRRLLVKSASSTASGSGSKVRRDQRQIQNQECKLETRWTWALGASSANTRRRIVVTSDTKQEAVDGYGGKGMRIASVEEPIHSSTVEKSEKQTPVQDQRCQSGSSAKNSVIPSEGDSSKNYGADQQRLQIWDLHFDKFPNPATFACWKIRFKTERNVLVHNFLRKLCCGSKKWRWLNRWMI